MSPPRYRTLDGDEVELPLAMNRWVVVPRGLARFDPELAWALDYDDAPEPQDADPRLDYSAGALLVPLERWNDHAELEPNLAPCYPAAPDPSPVLAPSRRTLTPPRTRIRPRAVDGVVAAVAARAVLTALGALALAYMVGVAAWLWSLKDGITGANVSTGLTLVGAAVLLAWVSGVAGAGWQHRRPAAGRRRTWPDTGSAVLRFTGEPLGILRVGLAAQLAGFALLAVVR